MDLTSLKAERFWEIDFFRGLAVLLMLAYHFLYDLDYFRLLELSMNSGLLLYMGRSSAVLFILVSGTVLSISYSRQEKKEGAGKNGFGNNGFGKKGFGKKGFGKYLKRGLKLFFLGLLLTAISLIFMEEHCIVFGILHFFGVSSVLVYPWLLLKKGSFLSGLFSDLFSRLLSGSLFGLFSGLFFILGGLILEEKTFGFSALLWLGFRPEAFRSLDYFPIFPWFGVLLLGLSLGKVLYPESRRLFTFPDLSEIRAVKYLCVIGKHSLFIYFVHQPLFIAVLYLGGLLDPALI